MSNPKGVPPIPSKELNPLQGLTVSKVDFYNLGEVVTKLRNANVSLIDIANEVNENHLPPEAPRVSTMSIQRWVKKNLNEESQIDLRNKEDYAINTYREECELLKIAGEQIETIQVLMDGFNSLIKTTADVKVVSKDIKELMFSMDKMLARKQALLVSVKATQSIIYNYTNMTDIINLILDKVKTKDLVLYADIIADIKADALLAEMYRNIQK